MKEESNALPDRKTIRLKEFDYSRAGWYFVTICAYERQCLFGEIVGVHIEMNSIGKIVEMCWKEIPEHFGHAKTDAFVVMPNHVHGIVILHDRQVFPVEMADTIYRVPTIVPERQAEKISIPTEQSLPTIVRTFKAAVTREVRRNGLIGDEKIWQGRFFERIIRDTEGLNNAREYIHNNPRNWSTDKENPLL